MTIKRKLTVLLHSNWLEVVTLIFLAFFVLLFVYTGTIKLIEFGTFQRSIHAQPLAKWLQTIVIYVIPPLELVISLLMLVPRTRFMGVLGFTFLMVLFTGYTALVTIGYYAKKPCSCGGVFSNLTWGEHLSLNVGFLLAAVVYIIWSLKDGRVRFSQTEYLGLA